MKINKIKWTDDKLRRVAYYFGLGLTAREVANSMTREFEQLFTIQTISNAKDRKLILQHLIARESPSNIKYYEARTLPMEDYAICCDGHAPFHSELWYNRLIMMSEKFGIKKVVYIGDAFDFSFAKHWLSDDNYTLEKEGDLCSSAIKSLGYFDKIYLCRGNHEYRVNRLTDGKIVSEIIVKSLGGESWGDKLEYSSYDKMFIGEFQGLETPGYMLVHPKSYSQISPAVARRLAEKYHRHIINTHGHLVGYSTDRSGRFQCVDLGGLFDVNKVEYIQKHTTSHPVWQNGFGMILSGKFHHFHSHTDFGYHGLP